MQTNLNGCQTVNANVKVVVTIICKQNQALIVWSLLHAFSNLHFAFDNQLATKTLCNPIQCCWKTSKKWFLNEHSCSASGPEQRKGPLDFLKPTLKHKLEFSRKFRVIFAHLFLFWPCSWLQMINLMEPTLFRLSRPI